MEELLEALIGLSLLLLFELSLLDGLGL